MEHVELCVGLGCFRRRSGICPIEKRKGGFLSKTKKTKRSFLLFYTLVGKTFTRYNTKVLQSRLSGTQNWQILLQHNLEDNEGGRQACTVVVKRDGYFSLENKHNERCHSRHK